ncbi:MAG: NAD(P)H-hydrate dehydratase [Marinobacter sp.]|nr:NAD(P)H-hydrate dehydratase [Marinobacter sp.]
MPVEVVHSLPESLYGADGVRALDRFVIDERGVPGFVLMQRAAAATFRQLVRCWPGRRSVVVLCGAGNNGGDGYLVAATAQRHGFQVRCIAVADPTNLSGDAAQAAAQAAKDGVTIESWPQAPGTLQQPLCPDDGVIVDALLGTGVGGAPRAPFDAAIARINDSGLPVLAVDVPSGLDATTGAASGAAVRADLTVSFIGLKLGLFTGRGPDLEGRVLFDDLGVTEALAAAPVTAIAHRSDWAALSGLLPRRRAAAHKGEFGRLLILAGERGFGGAGLLAAEAASRSGAGLVTLATRPEHISATLARCPSVMVRGVTHGSELAPLLAQADAVLCGPGIGQGPWGQQLLQQALAFAGPLVLDADALNMLASRVPVRNERHVLTPHPGEAARLLGVKASEVEADRLAAVVALQQRFGGVVLLKGAGTLIAGDEGVPAVIAGSNPGMATGGMGDVLSGILAALLAQGLTPQLAVRMAAAVHLEAANQASERLGYMGLLPMDVVNELPGVWRAQEWVQRSRHDQLD